MKYCRRGLYPNNHPYGILFDKDGVCSGCRVHEEKDYLNWEARFDLLKKIVEKNKSKSSESFFDCIVPVTGGGDSFFIVYVVKELLDLSAFIFMTE